MYSRNQFSLVKDVKNRAFLKLNTRIDQVAIKKIATYIERDFK